jgi:hypothetical protein
MLSSKIRTLLAVIGFFLLLPVAGFLQTKIDPYRPQYEPQSGDPDATNQIVSQLPIEFAVGAMTGFREAVAGLLWVRTDEFFDNGDYAAVIPMIRMITWLDPHQVDVYETGAWHMDYNFTDADQRSDRRYIPLALALLREGIKNNSNVPDMYGDMAFTHYFRKFGDFVGAADYFQQGQTAMEKLDVRAEQNPKNAELQDLRNTADNSITTTSHGLAHALEAEGLIPQAEAQWRYCIARHELNIKNNVGNIYSDKSSEQVAAKQLNEMELRAKWRPMDVQNQVDFGFDAQLVRVAPKVFLVKGTLNAIGAQSYNLEKHQVKWGPIPGCRVEYRLSDAGYVPPVLSNFGLGGGQIDPTVTIMQDSASARDGKFQRKVDMSQDPDMYSFTAKKYTITFWFNPSNPSDCPPNVQDRIGWMGEGLKPNKYYDTSGIIPGNEAHPVAGLHMFKKTITLTQDDLLGKSSQTVFD